MTSRPTEKAKQPDKVTFKEDGSIHSFLDNERKPPYRGAAVPDNPEGAKNLQKYLETDQPLEDDPKMGPALLEEALHDSHETQEVTEYRVIGYGDPDSIICAGVDYELGHNFETETKAKSRSDKISQV